MTLNVKVGEHGFDALREECSARRVRPYFVGNHSLLVSPPLNVAVAELSDACSRLVDAIVATEARLQRPKGALAETKSRSSGNVDNTTASVRNAQPSRLPPLTPSHLDADGRQLYEAIVRSRVNVVGKEALLDEHGGLRGPWNAEVTSPLLGRHLEQLGSAVRHNNSLEPRVYERPRLFVYSKSFVNIARRAARQHAT